MNCALRLLSLVIVTLAFAMPIQAQSYSDTILADQPFAYWRLDETGSGPATNLGTSAAEDATYDGAAQLEFGVPGLADPDNAAVRFKGLDEDMFFDDGVTVGGRVNIADSALTNAGGPFTAKTIEMWFSADNVEPDAAQVLYEQGGSTRGMGIYVFEGELVMGLHNSADDDGNVATPWPAGTGGDRALAFVKTDIEANTTYHIAMVYDGDDDGFEGTLTGYVNGDSIGQVEGLGVLFAHTDDIAIGGLRAQTLFEDGGLGNDVDTELRFFQGVIDEVALYDKVLAAGRIGIHFGDSVDSDVNADGQLNLDDFAIIASNFNTPGTFEQGDVNLDGQVSMPDFVEWRKAFQSQPAGALASVPEPSAFVLLMFGTLGFALRRRRCA